MPYILAIDFGTSGCRSVIYNENLEMLGVAAVSYTHLDVYKRQTEERYLQVNTGNT